MENNYQAFLLRLQRHNSAKQWRASLEKAHTGEILNFATEKELLVHLHQLLKESNQQRQSQDNELSPL